MDQTQNSLLLRLLQLYLMHFLNLVKSELGKKTEDPVPDYYWSQHALHIEGFIHFLVESSKLLQNSNACVHKTENASCVFKIFL